MLVVARSYNSGGRSVAWEQAARAHTFGRSCAEQRKFYSIREKISIAEEALWVKKNKGKKIDAQANHYKISKSMMSRWIKELPVLKERVDEEKEENKIPESLSLCKGRKVSYHHLALDEEAQTNDSSRNSSGTGRSSSDDV